MSKSDAKGPDQVRVGSENVLVPYIQQNPDWSVLQSKTSKHKYLFIEAHPPLMSSFPYFLYITSTFCLHTRLIANRGVQEAAVALTRHAAGYLPVLLPHRLSPSVESVTCNHPGRRRVRIHKTSYQ